MSNKIKYKSGHIFGDIMFLRDAEPMIYKRNGKTIYDRRAEFKCLMCGAVFTTRLTSVRTSRTKSCGCLQRKRTSLARFKHGYRDNPEYKKMYISWINIKGRCYCVNNNSYKNYGFRGICLSDEFKDDAVSFIEYIKSLPNSQRDGYTIDRINNDGNYERGNLRWADGSTQSINQRKRNNESGFTGVFLHNNSGKFKALINYHRERVVVGYKFSTPEEAAIARDRYIIEHKLPHRLSGLKTN